jgi:hypothetical protein
MKAFLIAVFAFMLSCATQAQAAGCTVIGGWPGAQYGMQAQILTDSLPCYGTTGTAGSKVVLQGAPGITAPMTITGANALALAVGRLGIVTPAFSVDTSTGGNTITGIVIGAQSTGNGINITATGETNVPIIVNAAGTGTISFGTNSTGTINFYQNAVGIGTASFNGSMAANSLKCNNTGGATTSIDCTVAQILALINFTQPTKLSAAINFNSGNTDTTITLPAPPTGYTRYSIRSVYIDGASASLNPSTVGLFTAAAGGGVALVASGTAVTVTSTADSTNNNMQILSPVNVNSMSNLYSALTTGNLFFRVQTASTVPATATVLVQYQWLP